MASPPRIFVASFSCWHCNRMLAYVTVGYLRHLRSLNSCHCLTSVTSALIEPSSSLHPNILLMCSLLLYFFRWILLCSTKDLKQLVACGYVCPSLYGPLGMCDVGFSEILLCVGAGGHSWAENILSTWVSRITLIYWDLEKGLKLLPPGSFSSQSWQRMCLGSINIMKRNTDTILLKLLLVSIQLSTKEMFIRR